MNKRYFRDSKLAKLIYDTQYPAFAELGSWKNIKKAAQEKAPFRYWIVETLFSKLDKVLYKIDPKNIFHSIQYRLKNRFVIKTHALVSHDLKRGQWHDYDKRMFYCLFDSFVDFVEIELAANNYGYKGSKKYRNKEAGLDYLKWSMGLVKREGEWWPDEEVGESTPQANASKEIYNLYMWYTEIYKNRKSSYELSGLDDYFRDKRTRGIDLFEDDPKEDELNASDLYEKNREIEKKYNDEETEMLIRLIKVRHSLWT